MKEDGAIGNADTYHCALKSFSKFGGNKISFDLVAPNWLKRYEKYMLSEGRRYTTIPMYLRSLRAIFNEAKSDGIIKENQYPFGKNRYEIPTGEGQMTNYSHWYIRYQFLEIRILWQSSILQLLHTPF